MLSLDESDDILKDADKLFNYKDQSQIKTMLSNAVTNEYYRHANGGSKSNSNHSVPRDGLVNDESLAK